MVAGGGAARADNPFGLMLWPKPGQDLGIVAARAAALGVAWFRPPPLFVDRWKADTPCPACREVSRSGLTLVVTLRNGGRDAMPRRPSTPPKDLDAYRQAVSAVIDIWKPGMLVVENEEDKPLLYSDGRTPGVWDSGGATAQGYARELAVACEEAHAHKILCANGGLSSEAAAALTWMVLLEDGRTDQACDFAKRTFYTSTDPKAGMVLCAYRTAGEVPAQLRQQLLGSAEQLVPVYRNSAIDAVNFHWYGRDAATLAQAADALARLTGKAVMSNEIGQRRWDADPANVRPLLRAAVAAKLKLAVWFSVDSDDTVSLFDDDGTLRPAGSEFAHQMSGRK